MKFVIIFLVFFAVMLKANAQSEEIITEAIDQKRIERIDSLLDDLFLTDAELQTLFDQKNNLHYLYIRSVFNKKTYFAGREIGVDQWNLGNQLFYLNSLGIFFGLSGVYYSQLDPGYNSTLFMAGYSNKIDKQNKLRFRVSYEKYFFHNTDPDFIPYYTKGLNAGLTIQNKHLGIRGDGSLNFGAYDTGKSVSVDFFGNFKLYKKGLRKSIKFKPELSLFYGIDYTEIMLDYSFINPTTGIEYTSYYEEGFGLMNVQLQLPLSFNFKNVDVQVSYYYNMPQSFMDNTEYDNTSFLQFSIGYFLKVK